MNHYRVGIISDTHNLVREQVYEVFKGVDQIIHAGDICKPEVLEMLSAIAPVLAVRGNNDRSGWLVPLPETLTVEIGGKNVFVIHQLSAAKNNPQMQAADIVISGHTHRAGVKEQTAPDGRQQLVINPGSAGPRRLRLAITVAELVIGGSQATARIIALSA